MAFIFIPLVFVLVSAIGIFFIVWKKMPYLKKLTVTDVQSESIWSDLFPELANGINSTRLKHYRGVWLLELEKFLRRLRVMSMKMDRMSDSLIKKIRNVTERKHPSAGASPAASALPSAVLKIEEQTKQATTDEMKREEQRLIIEIAKNPKNSSLYDVLGDLYVKMSNFADAKESYEAAIELNPAKEELKKKHSQALQNMVK